MFRTRDFVLVLVTVVFLLIAISTTVALKGRSPHGNDLTLMVATTTAEYSAVVYAPKTLSREERLAEMRKKVAESGELIAAAPVEKELEPREVEEEAIIPVVSCPTPNVYTGQWPRDIKFELAEGARLVYVESKTIQPAVGTGTPESTLERDVLLQLPVPFGPNANHACPASDVIGVAQDGSLIRNNETGLYSVFGENTLIGYALDGFPIYGVSNRATDLCGGATVGTYRYYLSDDQDAILNCYSGTPVKI